MENTDWQALGFHFKIWWIPQIGMKGKFEKTVSSPEEGKKLCQILADYDIFQFNNKIKPDYCNTGGIIYSHPHSYLTAGEWEDFPNDQDEITEIIKNAKDWRAAHDRGENWAC